MPLIKSLIIYGEQVTYFMIAMSAMRSHEPVRLGHEKINKSRTKNGMPQISFYYLDAREDRWNNQTIV